jgi:predicted transcriptional regulator
MDPSEKRRQELRHRLTLEALEDVDAGRVVDHSVVEEWADSLCAESEREPDG